MNNIDSDIYDIRTPAYDVSPLVVSRWSPRSMTGEHIEDNVMYALFEAARWAPSSRNNQPWHFCYAQRAGDAWNTYLTFLPDRTLEWAKDAALLLVVLSRNEYDGREIRSASFSTGAAWQNLALEATRRGVVAHPIGGFDREAAREQLSIPSTYTLEIMSAVGVPKVLERKDKEPTNRKPVSDIISKRTFSKSVE